MQNKNNINTNKNAAGSGFLLGFILGILFTLLLTTRKGREILKELLDKSIQKIADLEDSLEKVKQRQEFEENDYVKQNSEEVKKEILNLTEEKASEKDIEKLKDKTEEKQKNEKGGKQKANAMARRLFFRKPHK